MRLVVKKIKHGQLQFAVIARGQIVAARETPTRQSSATEIIASIRDNRQQHERTNP
ncbi:hypothetical protein [Actinoplanes sp. M2I2]|uniref:hypothetical protein n=1 Tax=Actinoplanes sp. M2I2 TaxID=1734444 RepID=UPI002020846E|nr:hypothetical protein [Actinoplanes sp. M2I2]